MVQMNNVTMVYDNSDVAALDNFSLTINEGEFAFLVGPSGSGKTTIIKLLTGEIMASEGEVIVNGFNMNKLKRRKMPQMRRTLGVIFQDFRLIDKMTVYDNVAFAMRVVGFTYKTEAARAEQQTGYQCADDLRHIDLFACKAENLG